MIFDLEPLQNFISFLYSECITKERSPIWILCYISPSKSLKTPYLFIFPAGHHAQCCFVSPRVPELNNLFQNMQTFAVLSLQISDLLKISNLTFLVFMVSPDSRLLHSSHGGVLTELVTEYKNSILPSFIRSKVL